jgi:hypothetical protein
MILACVCTVNVQWNKEKYEVDYDSCQGFDGFQALLFSLTNVPLERQKLMVKGKFAKDAAAIDALKDGDKVMLMGTADPPPQAPTTKIVFEEDLTDAQKIGVVKDLLSAGLHNLGNTSDSTHTHAHTPRTTRRTNRATYLHPTSLACRPDLCRRRPAAATWRRRCNVCALCRS